MKLEFSPSTQGYSFCWRGAHYYATSSTQLHAYVNQEESRTNLEEAGTSLLKRGISRLTVKASPCAPIIKPQWHFRVWSPVFSILATLQKKNYRYQSPTPDLLYHTLWGLESQNMYMRLFCYGGF